MVNNTLISARACCSYSESISVKTLRKGVYVYTNIVLNPSKDFMQFCGGKYGGGVIICRRRYNVSEAL